MFTKLSRSGVNNIHRIFLHTQYGSVDMWLKLIATEAESTKYLSIHVLVLFQMKAGKFDTKSLFKILRLFFFFFSSSLL